MKLIIQIPCLDEEQSIGQTLADLPKSLPGIDVIETLIVNDGSSDGTIETARAHGADHVVSHKTNQGLAEAFRTGLAEALRLGADIIVNTDGDNQYAGSDVARLVRPIVDHEADFVIGVRDIASIRHFSARKRYLQYLGSWVVRQLSATAIRDVTSGFRALSRAAATRLDLVTDYTHTLETIVTLGKERVAMTQVDVATNDKLRESRLFRSNVGYVLRCSADLVRIYLRYEALKSFVFLGCVAFAIAIAGGSYYLVNRLALDGRSYVALALSSLLFIAGLQFVILGFLGDSIACNRRMLSSIARHQRRLESDSRLQE